MSLNNVICDLGSTRVKTKEGFLEVSIRATRTGVMRYAINDVNGVEDIHGTGYVYLARKPEDVFSDKSLATLRNCSITDTHPDSCVVDSQNYKSESVGHVTGDASHDDSDVYVPGIIKDAATVSAVELGKEQVSVGISDFKLVRESGAINGQSYDYAVKDIVYNHISIVESGRAGNARILDGDTSMTPEEKKELDELKVLNDSLVKANAELKTKVDAIEFANVVNDAKEINPDFKYAAGATTRQIKVSIINDAAITDASSDELVNYAFENAKKVSPKNPPVITLSKESTQAGSLNDKADEEPQYNNWD
jgi:hypothetical protein